MLKGPKFVVIGGGTGSFTVLTGLKNYSESLSSIVNMVDDGGSTGVLRDEMGVLPPGDIRQSLVALAESSEKLRELFNFRFSKGDLKGHNFGNLFLSALEESAGDFNQAIEVASEVLSVKGRVLPVTLSQVKLQLVDGTRKILGEHNITESTFENPKEVSLNILPKTAKANTAALEAIMRADLVIISPGNLYSSLAPTLIVDGVSKALKDSSAKVVSICNLMNIDKHTRGFRVNDYAQELERLTETKFIDYVLYHNYDYPESLLERYSLEGEQPVVRDGVNNQDSEYRLIGSRLMSESPFQQDPADIHIKRTLIRHDPDLLARAIMKIYFSV